MSSKNTKIIIAISAVSSVMIYVLFFRKHLAAKSLQKKIDSSRLVKGITINKHEVVSSLCGDGFYVEPLEGNYDIARNPYAYHVENEASGERHYIEHRVGGFVSDIFVDSEGKRIDRLKDKTFVCKMSSSGECFSKECPADLYRYKRPQHTRTSCIAARK